MKKIIIILSLFSISCSFSQDKESTIEKNNSFTLTANIENLKDSLWVGLTKMDRQNFYSEIIDSTMSINGSFKFQGKIVDPSEYMIDIIDYKNREIERLYLWLESSEISILGNYNDFENAQVIGSNLTNLSKQFDGVNEEYINQIKNREIDVNDFKSQVHKEKINFLFKNPNNLVSLAYFLSFSENLSKDSLQLYYSKLDDNLQSSKNGIALKNRFEIEKIKIGEKFIDIVAKDLKGNSVSISDFKGKVIVLDFWAYWCQFCHKQNQEEFPKLKEKYKNEDFVIVSYSVDVDFETWKKSSEDDRIDWINISNLRGIKDKVVTQYGVLGYPTSFIIDKEGNLFKIIKGYEKGVIETELDKLFDKK